MNGKDNGTWVINFCLILIIYIFIFFKTLNLEKKDHDKRVKQIVSETVKEVLAHH